MLVFRKTAYVTILALLISSHAVFSQKKTIFDTPYTFKSKLKKTEHPQVKSWTKKKVYRLGETINLIVESNRAFAKWPSYDLKMQKLKKRTTRSSVNYYQGKVIAYYLVEYIAKEKSKITIPSIKVTIDNQQYVTKEIKIRIK